jgi:DNA-binding transcriptional LysR family regulator
MNKNAMDPALHRLTLAQLDVLRTVIATRGVGEAARALGISQPAVSKLLRQAERGLGLSLMVRDGKRVVPSSDADAIWRAVESLFGAYDSLQRLASGLRQDTGGTISVAAIPTQATRFMAPAIRQLKAEFPNVTVKLQVLPYQAIIESVASGQADFGLIHSITAVSALRTDDYGEQRILCIAPLGHRFTAMKSVSSQDLLGETYVSYGRDSAFNLWLEQAFARAGVTVPTTIEIGASPALIEVVRQGAGVGLVESAALSGDMLPSLVVRPFRPELRLKSRVLRAPARPLSRHADRMLEIYRSLVEDAARAETP